MGLDRAYTTYIHTYIHKSNNKIITQDDSDLGYGDSLTYNGRNEF